jgi:CheY-like chemotaxis protein
MRKALYIVLADDDEDDRVIFTDIIRTISSSIAIETVEDGAQLLEKLTQQFILPDIIFLDLNMPCMDGFDCLIKIRRLRLFDHIPVIIYSTSARIEDISRTYDLGANLYIVKPSSYTGLERVLSDIVKIDLRQLIQQPEMNQYIIQIN